MRNKVASQPTHIYASTMSRRDRSWRARRRRAFVGTAFRVGVVLIGGTAGIVFGLGHLL